MSKAGKHKLASAKSGELINVLRTRFEKNQHRHKGIEWAGVEARLKSSSDKLWSLSEMERTEGEPDVVGYDKQHDRYLFCDCSAESPKGRRSVCYDHEALEERKEHKPENSAVQMAAEMGIRLLDEAEYRLLQKLDPLDTKTSSWIMTPTPIRKLGGALFGDYRYGTVFIYHNGAQSYYAARGFRGILYV